MIYSRKMSCHSALLINIVGIIIYFYGLSCAQESQTTYVGKGVPVRINGRDFQLFTLPDGKRVLMLVTQDGGQQKVQTISNVNTRGNSAGNVKYRKLPGEKRKVLFKIQRQLTKILKRRINPRKYRLITSTDGIPRLALNRRRRGGLTFENIRKLIKLINSYLIRGIPYNDNPRGDERTEQNIVLDTNILTQNQIVQTESPIMKINDENVRAKIKSVKINQTLPLKQELHKENIIDKLHKEEKDILNTLSSLTPKKTTTESVIAKLKDEEKQIISDLQALNTAAVQSLTTSKIKPTQAPVKNITTLDSVLIHSTKVPHHLEMNNPHKLMTKLQDEERRILLRINHLDKTVKLKTSGEGLKSSFVPKNIGLRAHPKRKNIADLKMEEKLLLMQLQKLRQPGEITTEGPIPVSNHGIHTMTSPTQQEERRLDRILSSFNVLLSTIEKEKIVQMLYALDAGVGKGVGVRNDEIDVILRKLRPSLDPGDYEHLLHLLGANGYRIQNIKPTVSSLESIFLSTLQNAKGNLPKDVQDLLEGIKHLLTKEEDDEINKLIIETNGIISPSKEDMSSILAEAANAAAKKASGQPGHHITLVSKVKALFLPNTLPNIVSQVQKEVGSSQTNSLLQQIETLLTSHQKQSAVSQTETNSLLAAIETAIKSKPIPSTQQVQTNQLTDVLKSIQHMLTPPQQNNLQAFLGGQIMAPLPTIPQNNFFGNPMMVRPMNTMDSLLMQNLILGDTTDPPDPTDPPPTNCTKGCKHQPEIEAEDLPPTTTTQATTTIRATTKKSTPSTAKPFSNSEGKSELALLSKSVIDALKSAQLPGNVKVELHLPKSRQKTTTTTTTATSVSNTENMIKQSKINGIGQLISGRILNDQTGVVHIIDSQDTHQSSRSVRNKSNRGRFRLRIPPFEERMKTSEAIRSHAMESNVNQQSPFSNKKGNDKLHNVLPNPTQKSFVTNPPKKWWMSPKQKELSLLDKKKREDINDAPIIDTLILNDQYSQVILPDQFNPHKQMSNTKFTKASQWNKDDSRSAISLLNDDSGWSWRSNAFVRRNEDSIQTTMSSVSTNSNGYPPTWSSKIRPKPFFIQDRNKLADENYQNTVTDRTRRPKFFLPTRLPQPSREMNHLFGDGGSPNKHEIPVGRRSFIRRKENFAHTTTPSFFRERNYFGNEPGTVQRNEKRVVNHIKESIPYKDRNIFLPTKIPVDGHNLKPKRNVPHGGNEISSDHNFHQNTPPSVFSHTTPPSIFHRNQIVLPTKITYDPVKQPKANVVHQRLEKVTLLQQDAIKTGHQFEFKQPKIFQLRNSNGKLTKDIQQNLHSNHLEHQSHGELKRLIAPPTYFSDENNQQTNLHNSVVDDNVAKHPGHETQGHLENPVIPRRMPPHPPEFREPPSPRSVDDLAHLHHVQYEIPMTKMNIKDKLNQNTGINHGHSKNKLLRPLPNYLKVPTLDQNANLNSDFTPESAFHSEKGTPVDLHKNFNVELVYSTIGPQIRENNGFRKHQENSNNSTVETNYHEGGLFGPPPPPPLQPMASNGFYETTTSPMHHFIPTKPPKLDWLAAASGGTHNSNDHHHQHRTHQHHKRAAELAGKYIGDSLIVPIASKSSPYYHLEHKKKDVQSVNDNFGINNSLFNIKAHFPKGTMKESSLTLTELRHGAIDKHRFMTSTILPETMLPPTYPKRVLPPILDKVMHDQSINKSESANGHKTWKYMLADAIKKKNLGTVTKNKNFGPPSTTISNDKQSTSFWNTLMKKINVEAPTLASNNGRPPVIHIHLPPPFTTIETTTKMPSMMPITEAKEVEPIEAEDTTTTAKPTTSAVPSTTSASPSYKLQIHTDENGVNKISIIQEAPVNTSKQIDNSTKTIDKTNSVCSPKSPLFYCQGVDVFQNVSSISAWCVGKCIQGECVKSVCNCSCHAAKTEEDSMHDDIALLFKGTGKEFSTDLVKMFKGLYDSLKGAKSKDVSIRPAETKQPKKENVTTFKETNGPNEMKSLLSSIERLIDAKLHQSGFNNKGPEEVEAEDVPMGSQNKNFGNGNAGSVNSVGHEQNYQNNQNTQNSNFGPPDGGNNNWNNNNNNNNNNGRNNWGNDNGRNNWNNNNNRPNGNWNNNNNNNFSPGNNWQNNGNNGNNGWNNGNNGWNRGNSNNGWSNGQMGNWNSGPQPPQMPWQGNSQQGWGGPSMSRGPQWNPWMSGPQGWQRGPQSMWGPGSMGMGMGMGGGMWGMGFGGMGKSKGSGGEAAD